jgi:Flp pilus assembly protein CpaB
MMILLAAGLGLGIVGLRTFRHVPEDARGEGAVETVDVVVAASDIRPTCEITEAMVTTRQVPRDPASQVGFGSKQEVVGRVAGTLIPRGSPVVPDQLAPEGSPPGMACVHPDGRRAVTIQIDCDRDVAEWLGQGKHVDVVALITLSEDQQKHTVSKTLLRDVEVLALEGGFLSTFDAADTTVRTTSVTIQASPSNCVLLQLAIDRGARLRLTPARQPVSSKLEMDR